MDKLFSIIILFFSLNAYSQVNIETFRNDNKDNLSGFLESSANFQLSNVDILEISLATRIDYRIKKHKEKIMFLGKYSSGMQNDKYFKNEIFSHLRLNAYPFDNTNLGGEAFYQIQKDDFELLEIRQLLGCGVRLESDKNKNYKFSFGLGMMLDHEKINEIDKHVLVMRSTNYLSLMIKKEDFNLFIVSYLQPRIVKPSDFRILSEITNELKFNKSLSFNLTLSYRYDSDTPESVVKNELKSMSSLKLNF